MTVASDGEPYGVGLLRDELSRATDIGESRTRVALREASGLGAGDLEVGLAWLREAGEITEVTPDGFELVVGGEPLGGEDEGATSLPSGEPMALPGAPPPGVRLARAAHRPFADLLETQRSTVKLTKGVAAALDAATIGALVKAGIEEAAGGPFVLEVV